MERVPQNSSSWLVGFANITGGAHHREGRDNQCSFHQAIEDERAQWMGHGPTFVPPVFVLLSYMHSKIHCLTLTTRCCLITIWQPRAMIYSNFNNSKPASSLDLVGLLPFSWWFIGPLLGGKPNPANTKLVSHLWVQSQNLLSQVAGGGHGMKGTSKRPLQRSSSRA